LTQPHDDEDDQVRSVAIQNAQSILLARHRADQELLAAKEALELRSTELERANELIRTIAENAASCLLMLDERGIATYMNPAAIEETGYTVAEFAKAPFHDILHPTTGLGGHTAAQCPIRNARERMLPLKEQRDLFVRKDGSTFAVSCSLSPLQRDGRQAGAVLEFRDITDEILAQKALEDANRRKDEFLATLSHELRTPMTAVLGWARMLKLGLPPDQIPEAVDAIEKSAAIQAQLIDDVLDVSRISAGRMTFTPMPVDITPVLRAAMTTVQPAAAAKGIKITSDVPPNLPRVLGDEGRLQQIIWNLLSNAVKFTSRGGAITLDVEHAGSMLRMKVSDTGKGIDAGYLPHVFEPFSQEDATTTRSHEGIGLGLSIVRSLVELHGGRIRVASEGRDKGTTFTIEMPVLDSVVAVTPETASGRAPASANTPARALPDMTGLRVLVIDDQDLARDLVAAIFKHANASVRSASSVREALKSFNADTPDVVMCDLAMPEEDGFDFVRAIRALNVPSKNTPIIALTAFGRPEDRERALQSGFDAYLKKPVDPEELASLAKRLAQR
jgi:PAS domain S-box-containing protein